MSAFIAAFLKLAELVLGIFKSKKEKELAEFKILQDEKFKVAKTAQEKVKITDEHEKLVAQVKKGTEAEKAAALAEIRRRLGK